MDGVHVVRSEVDSKATYVNVNAKRAHAILADLSDAANTNITLTVRGGTFSVRDCPKPP